MPAAFARKREDMQTLAQVDLQQPITSLVVATLLLKSLGDLAVAAAEPNLVAQTAEADMSVLVAL